MSWLKKLCEFLLLGGFLIVYVPYMVVLRASLQLYWDLRALLPRNRKAIAAAIRAYKSTHPQLQIRTSTLLAVHRDRCYVWVSPVCWLSHTTLTLDAVWYDSKQVVEVAASDFRFEKPGPIIREFEAGLASESAGQP